MNECGNFQRNRYFQGKILTADDFITEQIYFMEKHRRHNRYLHGWGVVEGLAVSIDEGNKIIVEPGVALDPVGNLIVVDSRVQLKAPNRASELYVVLEYCECPTEKVPVLSDDTSETETICDYTRILEEYRVSIMDVNPNANHDAIGQYTYGCGSPHPICIAQLQHGSKGWEIIQCGQRAAKHPLQSTVAGASDI